MHLPRKNNVVRSLAVCSFAFALVAGSAGETLAAPKYDDGELGTTSAVAESGFDKDDPNNNNEVRFAVGDTSGGEDYIYIAGVGSIPYAEHTADYTQIVLPSSSGALDPYVGTTWLTGAAASAKKGIDVETSYVEANSPYEGVNFVPGIAGADLDDYPSHSIDYAAIMSPTNTGADLSDYPEFTRDYVEITMPESTSTGLNYPTLAAPEDVSTDVHGSTIMLPNAISTGLNYPALLPQSGTSVSRWYIPGESLLPQPGDIVDSNVLPGANLDDYPEHLAELSAITTVPSNVDYQSDFQAMAEANMVAASATDIDFPEVAPFNLATALALEAMSVDDEVQDFDGMIQVLPNNAEASAATDQELAAEEEVRRASRLYISQIHLQ
jgi:hypothetical protein